MSSIGQANYTRKIKTLDSFYDSLQIALSDEKAKVGQRVRCADYADGNGAGEIVGEWVSTGVITPDLGNPAHNSLPLVFKQIFGNRVSTKQYGAKEDGVTDDTDSIQDAFDDHPLKWVCGSGGTSRVTTVSPITGQRAKSLYLSSIGPQTGGAVSFQPVVEIDGTITAKTNMRFIDCKANGRRDLFTNIDITGGGGGEDGGMHAWRVAFTDTGGVSDIQWVDCEGTMAGTAGLAIHNTTPSVGTATYSATDLKWIGGKLTDNREHGWFADGFNGLTVENVDCRRNGTDLNITDPLEHGNRGARAGGYMFGASWDAESYTGYNGSLWKDLYVSNLDCRSSATPSLLYNPIATNVVGWQPHTNIKILNCKFDSGVATGADRSPDTNFSFNVVGTLTGTTYPYLWMILDGNSFQDYGPKFNGVKGLTVSGGYISSLSTKATIYNCLYWDVTSNGSALSLDIAPLDNPVLTKIQGNVEAVFSTQNTIRRFSESGGRIKYHIEGSITGAVDAGGDFGFTTVSPIAGMALTELTCSARNGAGSATATISSVDVSGLATVLIDTELSSTIYYKLVMVLAPTA